MKKFVLFTVFLSIVYITCCQKIEFPYEQLYINEGLTDNYVRTVIQDHTGFIWIGGKTGVFRFDGYNFVYYKNPPGCRNCLPFNQVYSLEEDDRGLIWVLSKTGIYILDPESERSLQAYRFGSDSISASLSSSYPVSYLDLMLDSRGNIWATNGRGLIKFSFRDNMDLKKLLSAETITEGLRIEFIHLNHDIFSIKNIAFKIYEDEQGNTWAGTNDGLYILRKGDTEFYRLGIPAGLEDEQIYIIDILQLNEDSFYIIGPENYLLTDVKKALTKPVPDGSVVHLDSLILPEENFALCLYKDQRNNVYIGSNLNTFRIHKESSHSVFRCEPLYINPVDESDNKTYKYIHQIMEDRTGILWTVNYFYGLIKYNLNPPKFKSYKEQIKAYFNNTDVNHIMLDSQDNLWVGVYGGGIYKIQKLTSQVIRYDLGPPYMRNNVITIAEKSPGYLWIGLNGGILEFNTYTGRCTNPIPAGRTARNLKNSEVFDILKEDECFYLATTNGLFVFDKAKNRLYQYAFTRDDSTADYRSKVLSPIRMDNGDIWIASSQFGINKINFNAQSGKVTLSSIVPDSVLISNNISLEGRNRIYKANNGSIWIINNTGLHRLHPDFKMADNYKLFDHIEFPEVWAIQEDSHGNLWMGTQYGLCMFNTKTEQVKTFSKEDGLPVTLHGYNTTCRDKDGWIYFGGIGGFYRFHPDSIKININIPPTVITEFRLFNKPVQVGSTRKAVLTKNIAYTEEINLAYNQNDMSFTFASLDFNNPSKNRFAYILEGYQEEWIESGADNRIASFTNLNPGKYVFRVKGSNNDGVWNEEGTFINIIIRPPFWKTTLAYIFYVVLFIMLLRGYIYLRTRKLRTEKIVLENQVTERTQKIEEQKEELKTANIRLEEHQKEIEEVNTLLEEQKEELMQQKEELQSTLENLQKAQEQLIESEKMAAIGGLVAGVAHEINTPVGIGITAISNLQDDIQRMAGLYEKDKISREDFKKFIQSSQDVANLIQKNLERTASLVQSFKQVSTDQVTEHKRVFNFKEYLNDILISLKPKFSEKNINFNVECDDELQLNSYPGVYAQIFTNLLLNSLQHGFHKKDTGNIGIKADITNDLLKIKYTDDGAGISKKDLPHIFEPFYTSNQHRGTGLGLNIIYNLVKQKLHGTITCESEPEKGVLFEMEVPMK